MIVRWVPATQRIPREDGGQASWCRGRFRELKEIARAQEESAAVMRGVVMVAVTGKGCTGEGQEKVTDMIQLAT